MFEPSSGFGVFTLEPTSVISYFSFSQTIAFSDPWFVITPHFYVWLIEIITTLCFRCKVCCSGDFEQAKDQILGGLIRDKGCSEEEEVSLITIFKVETVC